MLELRMLQFEFLWRLWVDSDVSSRMRNEKPKRKLDLESSVVKFYVKNSRCMKATEIALYVNLIAAYDNN